ncbi:MAG: hypothetical protein A3C35_07840 [Omnitrophica bacterium RIFCSPHIGHO2_02_FULL_46_11]|nr:MAG: hypothetical protein A3A81_05420 [Omnitrophica bacterium RIFCSPLOWO2_01_FULL_45_10b]OGW86873.1 MAG: hypothetical protein A3C35_07840 [Omnitrophica bacterium RIFCSPHIGHO2_02_FULL_46_11]
MFLATVPAKVVEVQKMDWSGLWAKMGWIDIVFLIILAVGIFIGARRGLAKVLSGLCSVLIAQIVAIEYGQAISNFLQLRIPIPIEVIQIVIFAALAVGSLVGVHFLFRILGIIASLEFKPPLNNIAGGLLGGLQLILLLGLISTFLTLFPIPFIQETFTGRSVAGPYLSQSSTYVHDFFVRWIPIGWQSE